MSNYKPLIKPINNFIKIKCWDYLKTHNLGNRGVYDGNKEKQFVGLLAEMETYNLLKGYYPDLDQKENAIGLITSTILLYSAVLSSSSNEKNGEILFANNKQKNKIKRT